MCALHSNDIECGRIYINKGETTEYRIKCLLCHCEFTNWSMFSAHIQNTHYSNNRKFHPKSKTCEQANKQQYNSSTYDQKSNDPEYKHLVLLDERTEYMAEPINEEILDRVAEPRNGTNEEHIVDLVVEILPFFKERDIEDVHLNASNEQAVSKSFSAPEESPPKTVKPDNRCFFQLRTTEPSVILGFIDIIRRHPCHWDPLDIYYGHKDIRDISLMQICKELRELYKICITPQLARSSILSLIRWFDREYLRSVHLFPSKAKSKRGRWSRDGYICAHPEYFKRLIEFLPYNHLKETCCELCQRKFKTENQLKAHKHHVHGEDAPFKCRYCKRSFLHASTWKHHENRHTKMHVWRCSLCSYISTTKTDYNLHLITHSDTRAYVCDLCGASYKSSTSLNVHFRTHNAPRLQCSICNKKFYENYRLKRHLMIHEAEEAVMQCDNTI